MCGLSAVSLITVQSLSALRAEVTLEGSGACIWLPYEWVGVVTDLHGECDAGDGMHRTHR